MSTNFPKTPEERREWLEERCRISRLLAGVYATGSVKATLWTKYSQEWERRLRRFDETGQFITEPVDRSVR